MRIAVTGSLGSGKSTVCKLLANSLSADLVDTDVLCLQQMLPETEGFELFKSVFGKRFFLEDGNIDRVLLRQTVFEDQNVKKQLEAILHPLVKRMVEVRSRECALQGRSMVIEVPLLYEVGWQNEFDSCVVVYIPEQQCIKRVMERNAMAADEVRQILHAQMPIGKKIDLADFIIDNSGTFVSTVHQVGWLSRKLWEKFDKNIVTFFQPKKLDSKDLKTYKRNEAFET